MPSIVTRPVGPTYALSVGATETASLAVLSPPNEQVNFCELYNSGTTQVCVTVSQLPASGIPNTPTLVFPVAGTPTVPNSFMLPGSMSQPRIVAVPYGQSAGFTVDAIGSASGPSIIYITPVSAQS